MTTSPGTLRRQKRMGPAPFASFEDLSDEVRSRLESPEEKNSTGCVVRLPGIREDLTPTTPSLTTDRAPSPAFPCKGISIIGSTSAPPSTLAPLPKAATMKPPTTPRIDISRASSSSHHDSRDSSPEREIFDFHDPTSAKLGLGFKEDGALDLRSSTEELDFQEMPELRRSSKASRHSPSGQEQEAEYARKDSQCSDIVLLSISGRTSRLSSIGSQGSGQSRLSNASHLSVLSGQSALSRSSSPHKLNLETSFCGTKPKQVVRTDDDHRGTKLEADVMEKVLLSRKHDPTEAILAEGIDVEKICCTNPPQTPDIANTKSTITITVDKPACESNITNPPPSRIVAESGVEYIYIPLKGPLPADLETTRHSTGTTGKQKLREVKSANHHQARTAKNNKSNTPEPTPRCKSATPTPSSSTAKKEEAKYIRIKLKPDRCYSDESPKEEERHKPDTLELHKIHNSSNYVHENAKLDLIQNCSSKEPETFPVRSSCSPKLPRSSATADNSIIEGITPSPSVSRRSSFASLFKGKDAVISPESPSAPSIKRKNTLTGIIRDVGDNLSIRSRSKSRDRDSHKSSLSTAPSSTESIDSKSKHKSVLSLFKATKRDKLKSESQHSSQETLPSIEGIGKVEFTFNDTKKTYYENPLEAASIRIPLHSPTYYEDRSMQDWKTSSQDSQETVIEASRGSANVTVEPQKQREDSCANNSPSTKTTANRSSRQSSTSSENMVFSTKLGNEDEVFTTKLPKQLPTETKKIEANGIIQTERFKCPQSPDQNHPTQEDRQETDIILDADQAEELPPMTKSEDSQTELVMERIPQVSSMISSNADEERNSSESERDSESNHNNKKDLDLKLECDASNEPERKAIFLQQDSFEDELPYVPTTLPLERSSALPIVPIKQRSTFEMRTFPIERPRSTTPINPSCLEEYCEEVMGSFNVESMTNAIEKLKISLPRNESFDKPSKLKSPRKKDSNTNWFEFAEKGINRGGDVPPPLPPKGVQKTWINFEDIPEKRKAPKRIQTIPSRSYIEVPDNVLQDSVLYNYVNPEECKCECHELNSKDKERLIKEPQEVVQEDELPLLEDDNPDEDKNGLLDSTDRLRLDVAVSDCRSISSDSSVNLSTSIDPCETGCKEQNSRRPFTSDLGFSSNRSSIGTKGANKSVDSPNTFPKIT